MESLNGHVMNLANSIIGVSVLAMPYCFKQCGIVLSILMLIMSSIFSRLACHFLLKSAILSRRKTFEFLAYHIFGSLGKLTIEIGMIGFLMGTCVAFFVVMGDLGPEIVAETTGTQMTNTLRSSILMALALFAVLPLGLLRNVGSLNGVSRATICFYCCLVLEVVFEATPHLISGDWYRKVNFWRPEGVLQCLPIFCMALFCQTQLFEIYQAVQNATLEKMNNMIRVAVNICTCVYIFVGTFGYIAFADKSFSGNILLSFSPSFMTALLKIGFISSVVFSFPLVIFPCRASLYSLIYKEGYYSLHEGVGNYISEARFKTLTLIIILVSLIIGIMIPNIESVLGLVGSTIGFMICVIFPVTCFISIAPKNYNERLLAQFMLMIGILVMILGTYKNVAKMNNLDPTVVTVDSLPRQVEQHLTKIEALLDRFPSTLKINTKSEVVVLPLTENNMKEIRHEPPQPLEPAEESNKEKLVTHSAVKLNAPESMPKNDTKNEEVDIEAIKKEDKEELSQKKESEKSDDSHQILIDTIQKQNEVQKEIVEQQKKLIEVIQNQRKNDETKHDRVKEEKMKAVKEIESMALKAIEKISEGEDTVKVVEEMEKNIHKTEKNKEESKKSAEDNEIMTKQQNKILPQEEIIPKIVDQPKIKADDNIGDTKNDNSDVIEKSSVTVQKTSNSLLEVDSKNNTLNEIRNAAPLFSNLGKPNDEKPLVKRNIPLHDAEKNFQLGKNIAETKHEKNSILENNHSNEVKDMRREILGVSTKR